MALPRPHIWLQNFTQFFRIMAAWCLCLGFGIAFMVASSIFGAERMWLRFRLPWATCMLRVLRVRLVVHGQQHLLGPGIFIANHTSLIDVVIVPALVPRACRLVAKREVLWFPIIGLAFARGGALLLDRRNPRLAAKRLNASLKSMPKNWSVAIFPEGTRSRTGALGPFKRGAFSLAIASKLPIVPLGLVGARDIIRRGGWWVHPGTVHVHVGAPLVSQQWQDATLRQHMAQGEQAVAQCLAQAQAQAAGQQVATTPSVR